MGLRDNECSATRVRARDAYVGLGRFDVDRLRVTFWYDGERHHLEVKSGPFRNELVERSSLDLPSYPELIEAAWDHQIRHAPKPPRRKKR